MARQTRSDLVVGTEAEQHEVAPDAGFTLVELVMAIAVMLIVTVPTLSAIVTAVRADRQNTNMANVQTVLQNAADRVNRATPGCDYTTYAQAAALAEGWPTSTTSVVQSRFVPGSSATVPGTWTAGACSGTSWTDLLVQSIVITVTSPDGKITRSLQVVKSGV